MARAIFTLVLALCAIACWRDSPDARPAPVVTATPAEPIAAPTATAPPAEPTVPFEQALECRKKHCYPPAAHCLDICYQYNHPRAEEHDACDANCRRTYDVERCEALCENEPQAFARRPKGPPSCVRELGECRQECKDRPSRCEGQCLAAFRGCAEADSP
ncbi:MAG: hypothetical protein HOV80_11135 [Polyangiaceae bacterium]|nr:hypothetical protein [Polyangiaceae bacterium]